MLTSALRALVNNPYKESFYGKWKKKKLIFWKFFSFYIKVVLKISQNGLLMNALKALINKIL